LIDTRRVFRFDWLLLLVTLLLLALGLVMISSATASMQANVPLRDQPLPRQAAFAIIGLIVLAVVAVVHYRFWATWRWVLYGTVLILLAGVQVAGRTHFGATSWFELFDLVGLQPSELAKIALIVVLARYFADHEEQVRRGSGIIISLLIAAPLLGLIAVEPDMGTAAVLVAIWLGMLFVAGLRPQHILILALAGIVLAPLVWTVMPGHARERIVMFLQPSAVSSDELYNVLQALISVGSGGLWGKGLYLGTQSQLSFLRVRHTDYIFAVLAEELGFVGSMVLLSLFAALLLRIVRIGARASDAYGRLIATGVATMIFVQVLINIGFHVGLLPVTGLPLPFLSYGGSSLVTNLIGLGLVESVALHRRTKEDAALDFS
jgi:rod shape determining protein RodA